MRKLSIIVLICIVLFSVFSVYNIRFLRRFDDSWVFPLFQATSKDDIDRKSEDLSAQKYLVGESESVPLSSNIIFLGQNYSNTSIVGWLDDSIAFIHRSPKDTNELYRYYPALGIKEEMIGNGNLVEVDYTISRDKKKVLINRRFFYCSPKEVNTAIFALMEENYKDYNTLFRENNSLVEIYDSSTKKVEELFKYTIKGKFTEGSPKYLVYNHGFVFPSNNFNYLVYCYEDKDNYYLVKYDINTKETKSFQMLFDEKTSELDDLDQIAVSNDGNVTWIIKQGDLYRMNLDKQELDPEYVVSNVTGYEISSDDRYIVYAKDQDNQKGSRELMCLDNLSKSNYKLDENIIEKGYALSSSGTIVVYLAEDGDNVKLYSKDFSDEKSERRLVYTFHDFSRLDCIDLSSDGKSVFISYHTNEKNKKSDEYKMCLIKL